MFILIICSPYFIPNFISRTRKKTRKRYFLLVYSFFPFFSANFYRLQFWNAKNIFLHYFVVWLVPFHSSKTWKVLAKRTNLLPITSKLLAISSKLLPITSKLLPITSKLLPITSKLLAISSKLMPITSKLLPITSKLLPITSKLFPVTRKLLAISSKLLPITSKLLPIMINDSVPQFGFRVLNKIVENYWLLVYRHPIKTIFL